MTREEKQKAIDALKISVPIKALTHEEFNDYIQTLNKIMDWLEQETVSKEDYDHEYFLRKEFELKIDKLERAFDKIRAEIEHDYEQDKIAREVFRDEKKAVRAEQCTGSISAYRNVLGIIDKALGRR